MEPAAAEAMATEAANIVDHGDEVLDRTVAALEPWLTPLQTGDGETLKEQS
jgi:hypothetical protein